MDSYQLRYALLCSIEGFTAVCAIDQLKLIKEDSFSVICNNQTSTEPGMHWVCFRKSKGTDLVEYFDSFALPINMYPKRMLSFCRERGKSIKYSQIQYQSNFSDACGDYCLNFLIKRSMAYNYEDIVNEFSETQLTSNDNLVKQFVAINFKFPSFSNCEQVCQKECMKRGIDLNGVCTQTSKHCTKIFSRLKVH